MVGPFDADAAARTTRFRGAGVADKQKLRRVVEHEQRHRTVQSLYRLRAHTDLGALARTSSGTRCCGVVLSFGSTVMVVPRASLEWKP